MSDTTFEQGTVIPSVWLNAVNTFLYDVAGTGAGGTAPSTSAEFKTNLYLARSITDYGALTSASAAANTIAIQAAIDANYGKVLIVPEGTFSIVTTGATVATLTDPVGSALTISDSITLVFMGILQCTNGGNNVIVSAGSDDIVTFVGLGGGLKGMSRSWNADFATYNRNGALVRVTSGIFRSRFVKYVDPVQYAVLGDGVVGGELLENEFMGGWATYDGTKVVGPNDNNYYIDLIDGATDWRIVGNKTLDGGTGRKQSQAVGSTTITSGSADRLNLSGNQFLNQFEKGCYFQGTDCIAIGNTVYGNTQGEGLRFVGVRQTVIGNQIRSCASGGITMYDSQDSLVLGNTIYDVNFVGIQVSYRTDSTGGKSLSNTRVINNNIIMKSSSGTRYEAILVQADDGNATIERGIEIVGNLCKNADRGSDDRGAITILPDNTGTTFFHLKIQDNVVDSCGGYGIRFHPGIYSYLNLLQNKVTDPGLVASRSGFRWENGAICASAMVRDNTAHRNSGSATMSYGFDHADGANDFTDSEFDNNFSTGWATGPFNGFTAATLTMRTNRSESNALNGSFTMSNANSKSITNSNARAGMRVSLFPTNAAAVALMAGTDALYWDGTLVANTSFTLKTGAAGLAAGTETFDYSLET